MGTNSIDRLIAAELSALAYTPATVQQSRTRETGQADKWNFCFNGQ